MEGVACSLLDALDAIRAVAPVDRVVLVGGGSRSAAFREVFAGLCDVPVATADADEAVAAGACVQAAAAAFGESHADVAGRWGLGAVAPIAAAAASADVRAQYARVRAAAYPS